MNTILLYFKTRLSQPSTWLGLASAGMALTTSGGQFNETVASALLAAIGLVHINEKQGQ